MPSIRRSCSNRIIRCAPQAGGGPLVAALPPGVEDCEDWRTAALPQVRLEAESEAIIVYNLQAEATGLVGGFEVRPAQVCIGIRRDSTGVPGLQACHEQGRTAEAPELFDE